MDVQQRSQLKQQWHESEHFACDDNSLIVSVYASPVFKEAEAYHLAALGDAANRKAQE